MVGIICLLVEIGLTDLPKSGPRQHPLRLLQACVLVHSQVVQNGLEHFVKKRYYLEIHAFSQIISSISILLVAAISWKFTMVNHHFQTRILQKVLQKYESSFHISLSLFRGVVDRGKMCCPFSFRNPFKNWHQMLVRLFVLLLVTIHFPWSIKKVCNMFFKGRIAPLPDESNPYLQSSPGY